MQQEDSAGTKRNYLPILIVRRFTLSWWAYTFPMTGAAIAAIEYAHAAPSWITRVLAIVLSLTASVTVFGLFCTTLLHIFVWRTIFQNDNAIAITARGTKQYSLHKIANMPPSILELENEPLHKIVLHHLHHLLGHHEFSLKRGICHQQHQHGNTSGPVSISASDRSLLDDDDTHSGARLNPWIAPPEFKFLKEQRLKSWKSNSAPLRYNFGDLEYLQKSVFLHEDELPWFIFMCYTYLYIFLGFFDSCFQSDTQIKLKDSVMLDFTTIGCLEKLHYILWWLLFFESNDLFRIMMWGIFYKVWFISLHILWDFLIWILVRDYVKIVFLLWLLSCSASGHPSFHKCFAPSYQCKISINM